MLSNLRHGMFAAVALIINVLIVATFASSAMTAPIA